MNVKRIAVLTPGFTTPNGRAFLFPLVVWRGLLRRHGFEILLSDAKEACRGYDLVLVDSKFHRNYWDVRPERVLADLETLRRNNGGLVYCDTTDSTGWVQSEVLPLVDRYWKFQLLRDRSAYLRPMYAHRIYADYYYRTRSVKDDEPAWSVPVSAPEYLDKLDAAWNSGLADYSLLGPYRMAAYEKLPVPCLLDFAESRLADPARSRPNNISSRFGASYGRASVAWQRREIIRLLGTRMPTDKLSRRKYLQELEDSKIVLSPFGFGEITLKDFEVFRAGSLLVKPDMTHLETWPDLFHADETMMSHSWDLQDIEAVLEAGLADEAGRLRMAAAGQERYRRHIAADTGPVLFCEHFCKLVASALKQ